MNALWIPGAQTEPWATHIFTPTQNHPLRPLPLPTKLVDQENTTHTDAAALALTVGH